MVQNGFSTLQTVTRGSKISKKLDYSFNNIKQNIATNNEELHDK